MEQINKLGIMNKTKIIDAYTPKDKFVLQTIANHQVYTIHALNVAEVACALGTRRIMIDILENKFKYALVIEDDVIFLENMMEHGNKWITKKSIGSSFNIERPYVLNLQCNVNDTVFYNKTTSTGGIVKKSIKYGQPAYIINDSACELFVKHFFPITCPVDDYIYFMKCHRGVQQGILVPYICRELSANVFKYNTKPLHQSFARTVRVKNPVFKTLTYQKFYFSTDSNQYQKLLETLIKRINPRIGISFNNPNVPDRIMSYCLGTHQNTLKNNYVIGGSFDIGITYANSQNFIISVRGLKSRNIIKNKFGFVPLVGDIFMLYGRYIPRQPKIINKYCFIYDKILNITCANAFIQINPNSDINVMLDGITNSQYVITNDVNYITMANSYSVRGVFTILNNELSKYHEIIAADYYSNFAKTSVAPLKINSTNGNNIVIDDNFRNAVDKYIQPKLPIASSVINDFIGILPFVMRGHYQFKKLGQIAQITK